MTELLNKAFEAARKLSPEDQDALGSELLERISADARWEELFADPRSKTFFAKMAAEVRADIAAGEVVDGDPGSSPIEADASIQPLPPGLRGALRGVREGPAAGQLDPMKKRPKAGT